MWISANFCVTDVDGTGRPGGRVAIGTVNDREFPPRLGRALVLRGTAAGLEFVFGTRELDAAWNEIAERLAERPDFYRGSQATAIFGSEAPGDDAVGRLLAASAAFGITLGGFYGGEAIAAVAARYAVAYLGEPPRRTVASFERKRAARAERSADLTEKARSLDPDFAGARADIATRRARGESSVPKPVFAPAKFLGPAAPVSVVLPAAAADASETSLASGTTTSKPNATPPAEASGPGLAAPAHGTLYHRGTLRGGQTLQQQGSIVVVGDVNPGAELVASGDIVVFGALRGTAHAGAQGDATARVFALELAPTQLRIAAFIAAGDEAHRGKAAEVAYIEGDRIAIALYAHPGAR